MPASLRARPSTWWPDSISSGTRAEPINPVAPVTKTRMMKSPVLQWPLLEITISTHAAKLEPRNLVWILHRDRQAPQREFAGSPPSDYREDDSEKMFLESPGCSASDGGATQALPALAWNQGATRLRTRYPTVAD